MCFSATASFAASGGLAAIGVASYSIANKKQKIIAAIPLLFAIQQAFEGIQWVVSDHGEVSMAAAYGFIFFAFLFWPVFIPLAVHTLDEQRQKILRWFVGIGVCLSVALLGLLLSEPLGVRVLDHSIEYDITAPLGIAGVVLYVIVVSGALIVSSKSVIRWLGILSALFAGVSAIFFYRVFISVWCFFAAILSAMIYLYLKSEKRVQSVP